MVKCKGHTKKGEPCNGPAMANGLCRMHRGGALRGAAHPNFKHGGRSKYMPKQLGAVYAELKDDPMLHTLDKNLRLTEALLRQRLSELEAMPDSASSWASMDKAMNAIERAYSAMSDPAMATALLKARGIIEDNTRKWEAVRDIRDMMGSQRADVKAKADIEYKQQSVLTANEAVNLAAGIAGILLELHIEKTKINEFLTRLDSLININHPQPILTNHS